MNKLELNHFINQMYYLMHKLYKVLLLLFLVSLISIQRLAASCPFVTASFMITETHSCGIPRGVTLVNISGGTDNSFSKYHWYINGVMLDSSVGLTNVSHVFYSPGVYRIKLTAKSPNHFCIDSFVVVDTIKTNTPGIHDGGSFPTWTPYFTNCIQSAGSIINYNMQFEVVDTIYNFRIIWGDTSTDSTGLKLPPGVPIKHNYYTLGHFPFKLISDSGGCNDTLFGLVVNERIPSASLTPPAAGGNYGCVPFTVRFVNNSFNSSATTIFMWDWGDGQIDTMGAETFNDTIYHTYVRDTAEVPSDCNKTIKLTAKNSCGQSATTWQTVSVYDVDRAKITVADTIKCIQKQGKTFTFQNASQLNCRPGTRRYYWDFGDGTNSGWINLKSPQTHLYPDTGKYTVKLLDSNDCGIDTFKQGIFITNLPKAGFFQSHRFGCKPLTINFIDTVTSGLLLRTRKWDFDDTSGSQPQTDTAKSVTHTFNKAGRYTVRCTAKNPCDTVSAWVIIEVYETPKAIILPIGNGCNPYTLSGFNQSTGASPFAKYSWDFGDSSFSTLKDPPTKTYPPGVYTIKLKINDTCGLDSQQVTFHVYDRVQADFIADTVCLGDSTHFNANATHYLGSLNNDQMTWFSYRDSVTNTLLAQDTIKNLACKFPTAGLHYVKFEVITSGGCISQITKSVLVLERPNVSFTYSPYPNICDGNTITFNGNASVLNSTITAYHWDFGDGVVCNSKDTSHRYVLPGTYAVKLTAYNTLGCSKTFTDSIKVSVNPKAKIKVSSICLGQVTALIDSSYTLAGDTIIQWAWDYTNDGIYDAFSKNTVFQYSTPGAHDVVLQITTNRGCTSYDTAHFNIVNIPSPNFIIDTSVKCMNEPFLFTNSSTGANIFIWQWGDASSNSTVIGNTSQAHSYLNPGSYTVKLFAYNSNGCMDSVKKTIFVKPKPSAFFTVNDTAVCFPFNFHFTNLSSNANQYRWYINNSLVSIDTFLRDTLIASQGALLNVRLIASNTNLCSSDTFELKARTFVNPVADFTATSLDSCNPFPVSFSNLSSGAVFYEWYFNDGTPMTSLPNPIHTFYNNTSRDTIFYVKLISFNAKGCNDFKTIPIHVRPRPMANFTQSRVDSCGPLKVQFINYSSPGDTESINSMHFIWNFGNGVFSMARDTSVRFVAATNNDTTYAVKLIAFSKHNCADTIVKSLVVHPNAKANFTMSRADSCGPLRVQFINTSSPGNNFGVNSMSFKWDFGNGINSLTKDTSILFEESILRDTVYQVKLIAYSNFGCPDTIIKHVIVYARPKAQFSMQDTANCNPAIVSFTNSSFPKDTGTINSMTFYWNFGNGQTSTQKNPIVTFLGTPTKDTVYKITLIAFSSHGCSDTLQKNFRVYANPKDTFNSISNGCSPLTISFNNLSANVSKSYWNFGDGVIDSALNPTHTFIGRYLYDTTYNVSMISKGVNGCYGDTVRKLITVKAKPKSDFSNFVVNGCVPMAVQFLNNSLSAVSSSWDFGDGTTSNFTNPLHTFSNIGLLDTIYYVRLVSTSVLGCVDTIVKPITISARPQANFTVSRNDSCGPFTVKFTNTSTSGNGLPLSSLTFKWDFGNGTYSTAKDNIVTFAAALNIDITYQIKLIVFNINGCSDTIVKSITVHPIAKSSFIMSRMDSCGPFTVNFINTSSNGNGLPIDSMKFKWDFGNGLTSNVKDTSVIFNASFLKDTVYLIKLIAYSNFGCSDTSFKQVRVYPKPKSQFVMSDTAICSSGLVSFNNVSFPRDTGSIKIMSFLWDFGNGRTSLNQNETVSFVGSKIQDTSYIIKLIAYSEHGCSDTSVQILKVYAKPQDSFYLVPSNGCHNFAVQFVNRTINGYSYFWDFGDGKTDTISNPSHAYQNLTYASVFYYPKLIATSIHGCKGDTFYSIVEVKPRPFADFAIVPDSGCSPLRVQFLNMSIGAASYIWDFGDGSPKTSTINPVHIYYFDSTYTVTLISFSQWGCPDTIKRIVKVKTAPISIVNVASASGCNPFTVHFNNNSIGAVRYEWYFGDAYNDTSFSPTHTYINNFNTPVVFSMMMLAYNAFGCFDTAIIPITVYPKPIANFTFNKPIRCGNSGFQFNDASINATSYRWDFGDGTTDTTRNPFHNFISAKYNDTSYTVTLIAKTNFGCSDTIRKTLLVNVLVHAAFSGKQITGCAPLSVNFKDSSTNAVTIIWYFGDGQASSIRNTTHVYGASGSYTVTLIAMGADGCLDSVKYLNLVKIMDAPIADFTATPMSQMLPYSTVNFTNTSISLLSASYLWDYGDGTTSTLKNDQHTYKDTGNFKVKLKVSNGFCSDSIFRFIRVMPALPIADFSSDVVVGCLPLALNFKDKSSNALNYFWEFGDGNISSLMNPSHVYNNPGKFTVRLKVNGTSGNDDTIKSSYIQVFDRPVANFIGGPLQNYLPKSEVTFTNLSLRGNSFLWEISSINDGIVFTDTSANPKVHFSKAGLYSVKLFAYSKDGCVDSITFVDYISVIADGQVYVPNAFSPNNDKINDQFKPDGFGVIVDDYEFKVYDRWGELIFESHDPEVGWDGTYNTKECPEDTYVWSVQGRYVNHQGMRKKGTVILVR